MDWNLLLLALVFALADWYCVAAGKIKLRWFTKPAVILTLLVGFTLGGGWHGQTYWFGMGLIFSLAGDVFLVLPPRFFLAALSIFLAAHIMYILGFSQGLTLPGWGAAFPLSGLIVADFFAYHRLRQALVARTKGRWLRFPIHLYQIIISLMLLTALQTLWRADWPGSSAWLASAGALLFFVSDTILAYNRFVALIRGGKLLVIITYHLGQAALICGVLLRG